MSRARSGRWSGDRARTRTVTPSEAPEVDGYIDLVPVGHGGSATVFRARQENLDRLVAIKVLHVDVANRRSQRRFTRERALSGRLSGHPNVVTVHNSGFLDGRYPYLAMEYFELGSLADRLAERGPFAVKDAVHIGVRIAGALESAHLAGIVHRDVKPQNILLSRFGEPMLADFGIAVIAEAGHSLTGALTPVHAAPELLEGKPPAAASDVFALGSTLYTLLAGSPPFAGPPDEGVLAQLLRITTSDLPPLPRDDVPAELVDVLQRATAKRPEERFPSAAELGRALQRVQAGLGAAVTPLPLEIVEGDSPSETPDEEPLSTSPAAPAAPVSPAPPAPPAPPAATGVSPLSSIPAPLRDDPTEHPRLDTPTIAGRHVHPPQPGPEPDDRRRRLVAGGAVAAFVLLAGAVVWLATRDGDDEGGGGRTTSTVDAADSAPITTGRFSPRAVAVTDNGEDAVITWTDRTDGLGQHVVYVQKDQLPPRPEVVDQGISRAVIIVDPEAGYCFQVVAVVKELDRDEVRAYSSEPECIRGALPADPDTTEPVPPVTG